MVRFPPLLHFDNNWLNTLLSLFGILQPGICSLLFWRENHLSAEEGDPPKNHSIIRKHQFSPTKVDDNSHRLLAFLLFARMFPISPSWLLNIVAPFLNIPLPIFTFSVFIGLAPYNFICVQAGFILSDLNSWDDVFSTMTMLKLSSFALLPLCYAMFIKRRNQRRQITIKSIPMPKKQFFPSSKVLPSYNQPQQYNECLEQNLVFGTEKA